MNLILFLLKPDRYLTFLLFIFTFSHLGEAKNVPIIPGFPSLHSGQKTGAIQWPYVYPELYKINLHGGFFKAGGYPLSPKPTAFSFGISGEFLWNQILFAGLGFELNFLPEQDTLASGGNLHRIPIHLGALIQLDERERHHILIHVRPGYSWIRSTDGNGGKIGIGLGIGYEYSLSSGYHLSPEVIYHAYGQPDGTPYSLSAWTFALRFTFGE